MCLVDNAESEATKCTMRKRRRRETTKWINAINQVATLFIMAINHIRNKREARTSWGQQNRTPDLSRLDLQGLTFLALLRVRKPLYKHFLTNPSSLKT